MTEPTASSPVDTAQTAGAWLRQAREQAGQSIEAVATTLKVPARTLVALEADDHSGLRDAVFVRALAQSVCRVLHRDPAPVLALLPAPTMRSPQPLSSHDEIHSTDMRFKRRAQWPALVFRPLTMVLVLIVLGALAVAFVPDAWLDGLPGHSPAVPPLSTMPAEPVAPQPPMQPEAPSVAAPAPVPAPAPGSAVPLPSAPAANPPAIRP